LDSIRCSLMAKETLIKFKDKFSKYGDTLPIDWQKDITDLLKEITLFESNFNQCVSEMNKMKRDILNLEKYIKTLEGDKLQGQIELRKLYLKQREGKK
jgi:hypothetical protein